eukprot:Gregarina_sp_Pseudo_9__840@NODE_1538_length_1511_cov_30_506793_g1425_i0_p1_GENE_NODE_1538_length_1511_cov_30_506793_g1425_i0NODE_1538_length_1511_cov_30_506793_g1425_i0_p1_ORF_typecomplete_len478_score36_79HNF1_N/PF04814_13/0_0013HNF1_N/PF04814_13/4_6e03Rod_C/PF10493_9/34Rod_C/PF10493_9/0_3_NODE_1538_length_1511_cov_30_506793_g1425_i0761437
MNRFNGNFRVDPRQATADNPETGTSAYEMFVPPAKCSIWLDKAGTKLFDSVEEAALFLLCNESISLLRFCRYAVEEKAKLMSNLEGVEENSVWKYLQLRDTSTSVLERKLQEIDYHEHRATTEMLHSKQPRSPSEVKSDASTERDSRSQFDSPKSGDAAFGHIEQHETEFEADFCSSRRASDSASCDAVSSPNAVGVGDEVAPVKKQKGRRRVNAKNGSVHQAGSVSLAHSMSINFDSGGELVSFSEVKDWKNPTTQDLVSLRTKVIQEWIKPFALKQQDIVKATGVGAPYICYLFRDPDNSNMTPRRRVEAYCVLSELMRKYETNEVTKDDFIRLRDARVERRYLKRQHTKEVSIPTTREIPKIDADLGEAASARKRLKRSESTTRREEASGRVGNQAPVEALSYSGGTLIKQPPDPSGGEESGDEADDDETTRNLSPLMANTPVMSQSIST